jgi:MtN3 and saliva related transmembrane protein
MDFIKIIGFVAASLTTFAFFPQAIKVIRTRDTKSISLVMYFVVTAGLLLWLIYGILLRDLPLVLANSITLIPAITILVLKIRGN